MTPNRGNKIANQFKLYYDNYAAFQSLSIIEVDNEQLHRIIERG